MKKKKKKKIVRKPGKTAFIDPGEFIKKIHLPLIVFSDHSSGGLQWIIKLVTNGHYNHIMWMTNLGKFDSQGIVYSEVDIKQYLKKGNRLKFIRFPWMTEEYARVIIKSTARKKALPWWKRFYDYTGILGQILKLNKFNNPWNTYCSEDVVQHLKGNIRLMRIIDDEKLKIVLQNLPSHGSPEDINAYMKANREYFSVLGKWDSDNE